jgi:hypothetical protein
LRCTATRDEKWINIYAPESKYQNMLWKHLISPVRKEFIREKSDNTFLGRIRANFGTLQKERHNSKQ